MARQLWEQAELTTADQMNDLTREAAQRFQTAAEADGAYDPTAPAVAGQVRMITGHAAPERPVEADGRLGSARPINEFSLERFTGDQWVDDAILPQPLQIGWETPTRTVAEPPPGTGQTATLTARLILNRPAGLGGVTVYITTTDGTATAPDDYVAKTREAVVIPHQATEADVSFTINASAVGDASETFTARIVETSDGTLGSSNSADYQTDTLTITISGLTSDIALTIADAAVTEGNKANLTITASRAASQPITGAWSATPAVGVHPVLRAVEGTNYQQPAQSVRRFSIPTGMTATAIQLDTINTAKIDPGLAVDVTLADLAVSGGDNIAASGNDLTARVSIADTTPPTAGVMLRGPSRGRLGAVLSRGPADEVLGGATEAGLGGHGRELFSVNNRSNTLIVFDWVIVLGWISSSTATPAPVTYYWRYSGYSTISAGSLTGGGSIQGDPINFAVFGRNDTIVSTGYIAAEQAGTAGLLTEPTTTVGAVTAISSDYDFAAARTRYVYRWFGNPVNATI